jgi:hypothetical protein
MNSIRAYISILPQKEVLQLIEDYETFERMGSIGDCALRRTAQSFTAPYDSIVMAMRDVAFEAYRDVARRYLEEIRK